MVGLVRNFHQKRFRSTSGSYILVYCIALVRVLIIKMFYTCSACIFGEIVFMESGIGFMQIIFFEFIGTRFLHSGKR